MGLLAYLLVILLILNVFFAAVTVFLERRDTSATWAWLLVLTFVPIFGFIIYLIFGRKLSGKKIFDWKGQEKNWDTGIYCQSNRNDTAKRISI